jgi:hypothetical protein
MLRARGKRRLQLLRRLTVPLVLSVPARSFFNRCEVPAARTRGRHATAVAAMVAAHAFGTTHAAGIIPELPPARISA